MCGGHHERGRHQPADLGGGHGNRPLGHCLEFKFFHTGDGELDREQGGQEPAVDEVEVEDVAEDAEGAEDAVGSSCETCRRE